MKQTITNSLFFHNIKEPTKLLQRKHIYFVFTSKTYKAHRSCQSHLSIKKNNLYLCNCQRCRTVFYFIFSTDQSRGLAVRKKMNFRFEPIPGFQRIHIPEKFILFARLSSYVVAHCRKDSLIQFVVEFGRYFFDRIV